MRITQCYFWALKCSDLQTISISFGLLKVVLCSMKAELSLHCVCMSASPHTNRHACCLVVFWHMFEKVPARVTSAQTHTHTSTHRVRPRAWHGSPTHRRQRRPSGIHNQPNSSQRERKSRSSSLTQLGLSTFSLCVCVCVWGEEEEDGGPDDAGDS